MHNIVITGSSGVLGQHILRQLSERHDVQVLAIRRQAGPPLLSAPHVRYEIINFTDRAALAGLLDEFKPTAVIHCAASGMVFPAVEWYNLIRFNIDFTLFLFELTSRYADCHFVHVSTGLAYRNTGRPLTETDAMENPHPYGASKAAADLLLRSAAVEFGVPLTVLRPFSFTGVGDNKTRLFPSILRAAEKQEKLPLSPGDQVRDFCSTADIARAIIPALERMPDVNAPAIFNLGSGRSITLRNLIAEVVDELGLSVQLDFGAKDYGPFEPMHLVADISRARRELGWKPEHNLAHAVWQLAKDSFPSLKIREPKREIHADAS